MAKDFSTLEHSNLCPNPGIHEVSDPARRQLLQLGMGAATATLVGGTTSGCAAGVGTPGAAAAAGAAPARPGLGFKALPPSVDDTVHVPAGYVAEVIAPWGEPVGVPGALPAWRPDASNTAAEQALQMGMHHDGMQYHPLPGQRRGLLVINHEYTDEGLLHPDGDAAWSAAKTAKSQAAHGMAVIEVEQPERTGPWRVVRPSRYARRITARTPIALAGPAAGHRLMRTAADPAGRTVLGTLNNCATGKTPWGTTLSGEENWAWYFGTGQGSPTPDQARYGLPPKPSRWSATDERFDASRHPHEFHRFGWVVEVDPMDPASMPVKRTALGRSAHEGAWVAVTRDGRAVVYSGEDARFECIYKFVSRDRIAPAGEGRSAAQANAGLLDHGTLYVARFDADGSGRWLPLVHGQGPLTAANGFADQAEVLVRTRQAAALVGGTPMDRPEWLAIDATSRSVLCTLTNNSQRGAPGKPGPDAANPRANNTMGHIIRWREGADGADPAGADFDATGFRWDHLVLAGDPANERAEARGNVRGDAFACPDGLAFDPKGRLWIQTDVGPSKIGQGEFARLGHNQMLACDLATGEIRRFLTGPAGAEITGLAFTPDARTMFVNIQHPGEPANDLSDPQHPTRHSTWPEGPGKASRPRSATVVVRKLDGGEIGS